MGISLGLSIHIIYSVAGLAAVVSHSAQWMFWIKFAGGSYLLYLGIFGLLAKPAKDGNGVTKEFAPAGSGSGKRYVMAGFICNALNPKAPVYFLSLFTVILSPDLPLAVLTVYGGWIMLLQLFWFSCLAWLLTKPAIRQRFLSAGYWIEKIFGVAMVVLGIKILKSTSE